jgi:hypothetical protein
LPAPDEFFGAASGLVAQQLGDLDADGKDDLAVLTRGDVFEVAYGKRWAGESALETDLQVVGPRPNDHVMLAAAGDLDSDGFPELLLNVAAPPNDNFLITDYETRVYVLRGTGKRLRGRIQLSENDRWTPPVTQPADTVGMFNLMLAGDIDGDGSQELLTSFVSIDPSHTSPVYLLPSTPRSPD